mmetsp:Transcript_7044/g.25951  ORF Transcript_7044/g.25951 Transcript_7044/m.25951 type:complete len:429 (-) Transcript_7044:57-1343(-)
MDAIGASLVRLEVAKPHSREVKAACTARWTGRDATHRPEQLVRPRWNYGHRHKHRTELRVLTAAHCRSGIALPQTQTLARLQTHNKHGHRRRPDPYTVTVPVVPRPQGRTGRLLLIAAAGSDPLKPSTSSSSPESSGSGAEEKADQGTPSGATRSTLATTPGGDAASSTIQPDGSVAVQRQDWFTEVLTRGEPLWVVPWTLGKVVQVMLVWFIMFWIVGYALMPACAQMLGYERVTLDYRGQAMYSLITDCLEMVVGLGILRQLLREFQPLPPGWFPLKLRGRWMKEVLLGCMLFPFVHWVSQFCLDRLPIPAVPLPTLETAIGVGKDPVANVLFISVVSICAPVWEEYIFRGFLLTSLTRYLSVWKAVAVSALIFSLAHFSPHRCLPLYILGVLMGIVFVRSRNLMSSIVLHSLWNIFVFVMSMYRS